jgi:hypothetical protein
MDIDESKYERLEQAQEDHGPVYRGFIRAVQGMRPVWLLCSTATLL